jgi:hypothetical protein
VAWTGQDEGEIGLSDEFDEQMAEPVE